MADFAATMSAFLGANHEAYIHRVSSDTEAFEYCVTEHLRMSGVYWGVAALATLGASAEGLKEAAGLRVQEMPLVDWVIACQDEGGGFGGNIGHDPHMLYTLSAVQILCMVGDLERIDATKVARYVASLQQPDGSFVGDKWGEVDTRFSYCAVSCLAILQQLDSGLIDKQKAVDFICKCSNFDGGFGAVPGAESHAGQIFCCVGALSIAGAIDRVKADLLGWWLSERQCDSGGLNGRPEKQADVCYSWWILSSMAILGRVQWIHTGRLAQFILACQDVDGGIADRPGNVPDIFHTFFGIAGLSLLGWLNSSTYDRAQIRPIDPVYALPIDIVERLHLPRDMVTLRTPTHTEP